MPAASSASRHETVPFTTPMPRRPPRMAANRRSNPPTSGPWSFPRLPLRNARNNRSSSAAPKMGQEGKGAVRVLGPPKSARDEVISSFQISDDLRSQIHGSERPFSHVTFYILFVFSVSKPNRPGLACGERRSRWDLKIKESDDAVLLGFAAFRMPCRQLAQQFLGTGIRAFPGLVFL